MKPALTFLLLVIATSIPAGHAEAQKPHWLLPADHPVPLLTADQREPRIGGRMMVVTQDPTLYGGSVQAEALLGHAIPLVSLGTVAGNQLIIGFQGGVFGRFHMDSIARELITTDWIIAVPFYLLADNFWLRLKFQHMSSHIGDEYVEVFGVTRSQASRDAVSLTLHRDLTDEWAVYGAADMAGYAEPIGRDRWVLQGGVEWRRTKHEGSTTPFAGMDFRWAQDADWRTGLSVLAGLDMFSDERPGLRFYVSVSTGPSITGEFHENDETFISLGASVLP